MTTKNYHELVKDRIYIGGADDVEEMMENEKADIIFDLRAEAPTKNQNIIVFIVQLWMMQITKMNLLRNPLIML